MTDVGKAYNTSPYGSMQVKFSRFTCHFLNWTKKENMIFNKSKIVAFSKEDSVSNDEIHDTYAGIGQKDGSDIRIEIVDGEYEEAVHVSISYIAEAPLKEIEISTKYRRILKVAGRVERNLSQLECVPPLLNRL